LKAFENRQIILLDKSKFNDLFVIYVNFKSEIEKAKEKIYNLERTIKKIQLVIKYHQKDKSCP
jgi:hypothetical protein